MMPAIVAAVLGFSRIHLLVLSAPFLAELKKRDMSPLRLGRVAGATALGGADFNAGGDAAKCF